MKRCISTTSSQRPVFSRKRRGSLRAKAGNCGAPPPSRCWRNRQSRQSTAYPLARSAWAISSVSRKQYATERVIFKNSYVLLVYPRHFQYYTGVQVQVSYVLLDDGDFYVSVFWPTQLPPVLANRCNDSYKSRSDYIRSRPGNQVSLTKPITNKFDWKLD
jgi:hypothetical protein